MIHPNSIESYRAGNKSGELNERAALVLGVIRQLGECTDREIKDKLGFKEMNAVRPRITELKKAGYIEECDKKKDELTGKTVRVLRVKLYAQGTTGQMHFNLNLR
jgi:predicted transcriptional regulator